MTLFNPNVELFTSVMFLAEFFSTGGVFVRSQIDPIDLHHQFQGISSITHGILGVIYLLFICCFVLVL